MAIHHPRASSTALWHPRPTTSGLVGTGSGPATAMTGALGAGHPPATTMCRPHHRGPIFGRRHRRCARRPGPRGPKCAPMTGPVRRSGVLTTDRARPRCGPIAQTVRTVGRAAHRNGARMAMAAPRCARTGRVPPRAGPSVLRGKRGVPGPRTGATVKRGAATERARRSHSTRRPVPAGFLMAVGPGPGLVGLVGLGRSPWRHAVVGWASPRALASRKSMQVRTARVWWRLGRYSRYMCVPKMLSR